MLSTGTQNISQKLKILQVGLAIATGSVDQFDKIAKMDAKTASDMESTLKKFELQLQSLLKKLVRVCMNKQADGKLLTAYKKLYSLTLQSSQAKENVLVFAEHLRHMLETIKESVS